MADCLRLICNNLAEAFGGNTIQTRYVDIGRSQGEPPDAQEIIDRIQAGLEQYAEEEDECI